MEKYKNLSNFFSDAEINELLNNDPKGEIKARTFDKASIIAERIMSNEISKQQKQKAKEIEQKIYELQQKIESMFFSRISGLYRIIKQNIRPIVIDYTRLENIERDITAYRKRVAYNDETIKQEAEKRLIIEQLTNRLVVLNEIKTNCFMFNDLYVELKLIDCESDIFSIRVDGYDPFREIIDRYIDAVGVYIIYHEKLINALEKYQPSDNELYISEDFEIDFFNFLNSINLANKNSNTDENEYPYFFNASAGKAYSLILKCRDSYEEIFHETLTFKKAFGKYGKYHFKNQKVQSLSTVLDKGKGSEQYNAAKKEDAQTFLKERHLLNPEEEKALNTFLESYKNTFALKIPLF